jgi:hypothetical protein
MARFAPLVCLLLSTTAMAGPPSARADQLAWLAGQWRGEGRPSDRIDAVILPPSGGGIVGVFRRVRGGQVTTPWPASLRRTGLVLRSKLDGTLRGRDSQDASRKQDRCPSSPPRFSSGAGRGRSEESGLCRVLRVKMSGRHPGAARACRPAQGEPVVQATPALRLRRIDAASWMRATGSARVWGYVRGSGWHPLPGQWPASTAACGAEWSPS